MRFDYALKRTVRNGGFRGNHELRPARPLSCALRHMKGIYHEQSF